MLNTILMSKKYKLLYKLVTSFSKILATPLEQTLKDKGPLINDVQYLDERGF